MLAMHLGVNRTLVPRLRLGIPRWRRNLSLTSRANFPTSVQYLKSDLLLSTMGTNGRTGRRRKRKKNGNYHRKYGRAIQDSEYIALLKWAKRNGISFWKLRPAYFPQTGRGLMTCKKLASGDLVIALPEHMLITTKTVEQSEIGKLLIKLQLMSLLSTNQMLCVFILYEKYRGESSFWHPYISTLPRSFNTPAYFNEEELGALPSCMHQQCETQITTVCESYEELKGFLEHSTSILDKTFLDSLTFDEFRWAWFVVNTRSVYKADEVDTLHVGMATRHTENTYALAPVLDLLNHTDIAEVNAGFNQGSSSYEIHTLTAYNKGMQVFINYGPRDNRKLLMEYGFILPKNLHNTVTFSRDQVYSVVMPEISGISKKKREIIAANQLEKDLCCSEGNGLSWSVLVLLKILAMNEEEFKRYWQRTLTGELVGGVIESRVLQWRQCLIQRALEPYEEADKGDINCLKSDGQLSVNMDLALQLRIQEKQILTNALELLKIS